MTGGDRYQPSWDRVGAYELDYTGVVPQPELLAYTIGELLSDDDELEIPSWGARAVARQLANLRGRHLPSALHHFAITGEGAIGEVMEELTDLVSCRAGDEDVRILSTVLAHFLHQGRGRIPPTDGQVENGDAT